LKNNVNLQQCCILRIFLSSAGAYSDSNIIDLPVKSGVLKSKPRVLDYGVAMAARGSKSSVWNLLSELRKYVLYSKSWLYVCIEV